MTTPSLATLLVPQTKAEIYDYAIGIAQSLGLPVTTWQAGDPTRSLYHVEAEFLALLDALRIGFTQSGFLDTATGIWLKVLAYQVYGVTVPEASYATTTVLLTNTAGGLYADKEAGDMTFRNSTSGATYRNTTGGTLAVGPGTTLSVTVVADEPGADSSAAAGEIDEFVTGWIGVTCTNAAAAIGVDEQDEETTRQQCRDMLGSLSPNGPKEAYAYVAKNSDLTGTTAVNRTREYADSDTGDVLQYIAGPSGAVSEPVRLLVEAAILEWATPLCITPTILSATNVPVAVTYSAWIYSSANKTTAEVEEAVEAKLEQMFASRRIGGDIISPATTGSLYGTLIESTIRETFPEIFRVVVTTPAGDTALGNGQVATLGTITATINLVTG